MTLSEYVLAQTAARIARLSDQALQTSQASSETAVHDLRTTIRRLNETLKVFADVFPRGAAKTVRNDLRAAMRCAGEARNVDIARQLMVKAGVAPAPELDRRRHAAEQRLASVLADWNRGAAAKAWKEQLHA